MRDLISWQGNNAFQEFTGEHHKPEARRYADQSEHRDKQGSFGMAITQPSSEHDA
jgi:hypothetical protein